MDRVKNKEVRRRTRIERQPASRVDQRILRWFGHVERMDEYHKTRTVLVAAVSEGMVQDRPRLGWIEDVNMVSFCRGMTMEVARKIGRSIEP